MVQLSVKKRTIYSIKNLFTDLKKISPTPRALSKVGSELIYSEWNSSITERGRDHTISQNLEELLNFMENQYEQIILSGNLTTVKDTPSSILNTFLNERPSDFIEYTILRPPDYIYNILKDAVRTTKDEASQCKKIEKGIRKQMKNESESFEYWNQLRILLWIQGKYKEAAEALREAKKLGWTPENSTIVSII